MSHIDASVEGFYAKNPHEGYRDSYDSQHGGRLDAMVRRFNLATLKDQRVLDVGGGLGFLGKRLDPSNDYTVIDGAAIAAADRLCAGTWAAADLDHDRFSWSVNADPVYKGWGGGARCGTFDVAFHLEVLEHLGSPYHCLAEVKKLVKQDGLIYLSVPHENVTHNVVYPSLLWPEQNFEQWLGQMALPIVDRWLWSAGWNARHYVCRNAAWSEKRLLYPKQEAKFIDCTSLEATNL